MEDKPPNPAIHPGNSPQNASFSDPERTSPISSLSFTKPSQCALIFPLEESYTGTCCLQSHCCRLGDDYLLDPHCPFIVPICPTLSDLFCNPPDPMIWPFCNLYDLFVTHLTPMIWPFLEPIWPPMIWPFCNHLTHTDLFVTHLTHTLTFFLHCFYSSFQSISCDKHFLQDMPISILSNPHTVENLSCTEVTPRLQRR